MPQPELDYTWTLTSTGGGAWVDCRAFARETSFYVQSAAGSSASIQIETARDSTSYAIKLGTAQTVDASSGVLLQFTGAYRLMRPYSSNLSGTVVVYLTGN